jgi:hypothetical protein
MSTLIAIPFFTDNVAIRPHTATMASHIGRRLTVKAFSKGAPVSVYRIEGTNELVFKKNGIAGNPFSAVFAEGPEV